MAAVRLSTGAWGACQPLGFHFLLSELLLLLVLGLMVVMVVVVMVEVLQLDFGGQAEWGTLPQ